MRLAVPRALTNIPNKNLKKDAMSGFQGTRKPCGDDITQAESTQKPSKRVRCQQELRTSGEPCCDESGTHREVHVALKKFKQNSIEEKYVSQKELT